jgi:hypothetical protein
MLLAMAKKKQAEKTAEKTLQINEEELNILNEVLADYKGFIEYTYKNNVAIIAQGEQMLKTSSDKDKTIDLIKAIDKYKEQAKYLDIARLRADSVHLKVKDALGIKNEPDEVIEPSGDGTEQNDTSADQPSAEVSESVEVLPEEG